LNDRVSASQDCDAWKIREFRTVAGENGSGPRASSRGDDQVMRPARSTDPPHRDKELRMNPGDLLVVGDDWYRFEHTVDERFAPDASARGGGHLHTDQELDVGVGLGIAYWTGGGSGSGSANTGTAAGVTVIQTVSPTSQS